LRLPYVVSIDFWQYKVEVKSQRPTTNIKQRKKLRKNSVLGIKNHRSANVRGGEHPPGSASVDNIVMLTFIVGDGTLPGYATNFMILIFSASQDNLELYSTLF